MTPKERLLNTLDFKKTDTIPIYDIINNKSIYNVYGGGKNLDDNIDILEIAAHTYKELGIDVTRGFYNPKWQVNLVDLWIKYLGAPDKGWVVDSNDYTSWIEKRPYNNLQDLFKNMPNYYDNKQMEEEFIESFLYRKEKFKPDVEFIASIGGFLDLSYRFIGYELFCEGIFDDMELIDELMDVFFRMQKAYIRIYAENQLGPALVYCDDIAFKTSLLFSPDFLDKKYFPRLKEMFAVAREFGIKVIFHSDGNLNEIMDCLVECRIDALNPLEKLADMDIVDIRKKYPNLPLVGGIDCSQLLTFGTLEDIKKEIERIVNSIGAQGGILLGSTSEIHNEISAEKCKYLYDTIKEYGAKL